jgi:hypothetical protein
VAKQLSALATLALRVLEVFCPALFSFKSLKIFYIKSSFILTAGKTYFMD